jgi:hypothetical protein
MQEKGKDALKAIGFNYISHSNGSVYTKNTYDESRDYTNNKPECFFINIECSMVGGNWENNDVNDFDIDEQREILVAKMVKDFEEITGEKIKINQISLEGNNTPMIQVMFK